jgi:hypothetical protein
MKDESRWLEFFSGAVSLVYILAAPPVVPSYCPNYGVQVECRIPDLHAAPRHLPWHALCVGMAGAWCMVHGPLGSGLGGDRGTLPRRRRLRAHSYLRRRLVSTTNPRWLSRSTASGCGWRRAGPARIYSRAPALRPLLHRRRSCSRGPATRRRPPRARGAQPCPVLRLRCARGGGGHRHARGGRPPARESLLPRASLAWAAGTGGGRRRGAAAQVPLRASSTAAKPRDPSFFI